MTRLKQTRADSYTRTIQHYLNKYDQFKKVKERYKLMRVVMQEYFPLLTNSTSKDTMEQFLREVIHVDRKVRKMTEGEDEEHKAILSHNYQMEELDYEPNYHQNLKKLETL